ncbi:hypothetical protein BC628DRAFT_1421355 [Trametes gibbosa]|nr:hypothetical protein BC628DRAFT_1421355 [Trametes gibbosa]
MAFKANSLFAFVLFMVLSVAIEYSSARSTSQIVTLTSLRDDLDRPVYSWLISADEQARLTALLEHDFDATGVVGTYVTQPPQACSRCGKETEFIDWVYTALARGVHTPGFIIESLKEGQTPKGVHHDVYCSRCGHLTAFRDHTGNEGGVKDIAYSTPYDHTSKIFGEYYTSPTSSAKTPGLVTPRSVVTPQVDLQPAGWCQRCVGGNWLIKRAEDAVEVVPEEAPKPAGWCQRCVGGNWLIKKEMDDLD